MQYQQKSSKNITLLSSKIDNDEYLIGKEILPSDQSRIIE